MKANELRIGNLVNGVLDNGNQFIFEVITLSSEPEKIEVYCQDPRMGLSVDDYWEPIPLTEEWLIKFGFEKSIDHYTRIYRKEVYRNNGIELHWSVVSETYYTYLGYNTGVRCNPTIYVHSLQNLYFALTGEELTIK